MADEKKIILEVQNLTKYFDTPKGKLHAVDGVSFQIEEGKTLGVVGESGCGKSTTGRTLLKLTEPTSGKIIFDGEDITRYNRSRMRALRTKMQMIFQDPFSSLDPPAEHYAADQRAHQGAQAVEPQGGDRKTDAGADGHRGPCPTLCQLLPP